MTHGSIFGFWLGDDVMNDNRKRGWESFAKTGLEPILINLDNLDQWVVPDAPLHPAFPYLSLVHKSDYLRPYVMYHHGGGYADIKPQFGSWLPAVDRVQRSSWLWGAGYREIRGGSVWLQKAPIDDRFYVLSHPVPQFAAKLATDLMRLVRPLLIGNTAYYFKRHNPLAKAWLAEVERRLDLVLDRLKTASAPETRARLGDESGYPLPWSSIHGDVVQPLGALHFTRLDRGLPPPGFQKYS